MSFREFAHSKQTLQSHFSIIFIWIDKMRKKKFHCFAVLLFNKKKALLEGIFRFLLLFIHLPICVNSILKDSLLFKLECHNNKKKNMIWMSITSKEWLEGRKFSSCCFLPPFISLSSIVEMGYAMCVSWESKHLAIVCTSFNM